MLNDDDVTNPQADNTKAPAPEVTEAPEVETEEPEAVEGETDDQVEGDDETEELEHEGKKYVIPKAIKPLLMFQQDYTKKTQEVAETRKQFEERVAKETAEFETTRRTLAENVEGVAQLLTLKQQIDQYNKVDWDKFYAEQPQKAGATYARFQQLKDAHVELQGALEQRSNQAALEQQRTRAKQIEDGRAALSSKIPGWTDQRDKQAREFAVSRGMSKADVDTIINPVYMEMIDYARVGYELTHKARAAATPKPNPIAPQIEAVPVPTVGARRSPQSSAPSDKDDMATWAKKEQARVARLKRA